MLQNQSLERSNQTALVAKDALPVTTPRMDIYENDEAYQLAIEMPGAEESSIDVVMAGDVLNIRGKANVPTYAGYSLRYSEHQACEYHRRLRVGANVETENISAHLASGILRVTLPKRASARPRRIAIKSE